MAQKACNETVTILLRQTEGAVTEPIGRFKGSRYCARGDRDGTWLCLDTSINLPFVLSLKMTEAIQDECGYAPIAVSAGTLAPILV